MYTYFYKVTYYSSLLPFGYRYENSITESNKTTVFHDTQSEQSTTNVCRVQYRFLFLFVYFFFFASAMVIHGLQLSSDKMPQHK